MKSEALKPFASHRTICNLCFTTELELERKLYNSFFALKDCYSQNSNYNPSNKHLCRGLAFDVLVYFDSLILTVHVSSCISQKVDLTPEGLESPEGGGNHEALRLPKLVIHIPPTRQSVNLYLSGSSRASESRPEEDVTPWG